MNSAGKTVLLVDDSEMVIRLTSFMLKSAGYKVLTSCDGEDALTQFDKKNIDLVITDLNMPNKDGLQLINEIRNMQYYKFLPVVLFVSDSTISIREYIKTSGATVLLSKDALKEKLVSTVKKIIG
ncbi:response regulator [Mucilaginibacter ginsenosidivorax]|uniref:Response regulator n=1 Tax=Mucilaginibacter ginsenosidivorax TaxID=862126 RepID=A0A5B8W0M5_9SPHI|nr:response regulator [Mucilaginibacter ginsenosidivorax]QEC76445.1 response regulator [Mucilaginibacter ginsenosidivorax]